MAQEIPADSDGMPVSRVKATSLGGQKGKRSAFIIRGYSRVSSASKSLEGQWFIHSHMAVTPFSQAPYYVHRRQGERSLFLVESLISLPTCFTEYTVHHNAQIYRAPCCFPHAKPECLPCTELLLVLVHCYYSVSATLRNAQPVRSI